MRGGGSGVYGCQTKPFYSEKKKKEIKLYDVCVCVGGGLVSSAEGTR